MDVTAEYDSAIRAAFSITADDAPVIDVQDFARFFKYRRKGLVFAVLHGCAGGAIERCEFAVDDFCFKRIHAVLRTPSGISAPYACIYKTATPELNTIRLTCGDRRLNCYITHQREYVFFDAAMLDELRRHILKDYERNMQR